MASGTAGNERRKWDRLRVPVPIFVRGLDESGKPFVEFSTALNISAGGALLAIKRYLPSDTKVSLEIPAPAFPRKHLESQNLKAKIVQVRNSDRYHLCGLSFSRPLKTN